MKLYSWENPFLERISAIRQNEIRTMKRTAVYRALNGLMWEIAPLLVTIVSFIVYSKIGDVELKVKKIFRLSSFMISFRILSFRLVPSLFIYMYSIKHKLTKLNQKYKSNL